MSEPTNAAAIRDLSIPVLPCVARLGAHATFVFVAAYDPTNARACPWARHLPATFVDANISGQRSSVETLGCRTPDANAPVVRASGRFVARK
jgi:hypothetical protein